MLISDSKARSIGRQIARIEPRFAPVVAAFSPCPIGVQKPRQSAFASLASSIISQQLSTKAAATIIERVRTHSGGNLGAERIADLNVGDLRKLGCSQSKARALTELAAAVATKQLNLRSLARQSDEEVISQLLPYFGIGKWTVEMFLIFQLGRLDVWPVGDLGVRRGWEKIHRRSEEIKISELADAGAKFAPYRSHLAWYCWRALSLN